MSAPRPVWTEAERARYRLERRCGHPVPAWRVRLLTCHVRLAQAEARWLGWGSILVCLALAGLLLGSVLRGWWG